MGTRSRALVSLNDSSLTTQRREEDIRGRDVFDAAGDKIGHVKDLLIDENGERVRFFEIAHGGFLGIGEDRIVAPVDIITAVEEDGVHIDRGREVVAGTPVYNPELAHEADFYDSVYTHYGVQPYWNAGYRNPAYPFLPY